MERNKWCVEIREDLKSTQPDISWTSSDSETELKQCNRHKKRRKKVDTGSVISWINPILTETKCPHTSKSPEDSPVISSLHTKEMSPVLTQASGSESKEASPVIGKRRLLKQMRTKFKRSLNVTRDIAKEISCSPDIFESQNSQTIEHCTPDLLIKLNMSEGDFIYSFPSQQCSPIKSLDSSITNNSDDIFYPKLIRRRRSKKKGLASKLQRSLSLQKTRTSIWKHEHSMKRTSETEDIVQLKVLQIKKEYGITFLECHEIDPKSMNSNKDGLVSSEDTNCILVLTDKCETGIMETNMYKLFPPYESKIIIYKSKEIVCYFNITRILK